MDNFWIVGLIIFAGLIIGGIIFLSNKNRSNRSVRVQRSRYKPDAHRSDETVMSEEEYDELHEDDDVDDDDTITVGSDVEFGNPLNSLTSIATAIVVLGIMIAVGVTVLSEMGEVFNSEAAVGNMTTAAANSFDMALTMIPVVVIITIVVLIIGLINGFRLSSL